MAEVAVNGMAPPPPPPLVAANSVGADTTAALCTPRPLLPAPLPLALPLPLPLPCCAAELTQEPVLLRELRLSECEECDGGAADAKAAPPDVPADVLDPPPPTPATIAVRLLP